MTEYEYFNPTAPKLYRPFGNYLSGLGDLFSVHLCDDKPHEWHNDKCVKCGLERSKR
jgi:hypothetical protein